MIEQQKQGKYDQEVRLPLGPFKTVWIENEEATNDNSRKQSAQIDEEFKKEHQHYLALKRQRVLQEKKQMIQEFGDSSSDEEVPAVRLIKVEQSPVYEEDTISMPKQELAKPSTADSSKEKQGGKDGKEGTSKSVEPDSFRIIVSSKKGETWFEGKITITEKIVMLPNIDCPYYDINKLKLIFSEVGDHCFKLKVNWKNDEFIFGASYQRTQADRHEAFYIFASIIGHKLSLMGRKPLAHSDSKSHGIPEAMLKNSYIYGRLMKKSRVISRWSDILAVISKEGLHYFKKGGEKGDLLVPRNSIEELWTRFEFQNEWLIVKLFQDGRKIELGIPVLDEVSVKGWLFHLYGLFFKNN